ncbi:hypothetical protein GN956_G10847 [Arapaima gigas]
MELGLTPPGTDAVAPVLPRVQGGPLATKCLPDPPPTAGRCTSSTPKAEPHSSLFKSPLGSVTTYKSPLGTGTSGSYSSPPGLVEEGTYLPQQLARTPLQLHWDITSDHLVGHSLVTCHHHLQQSQASNLKRANLSCSSLRGPLCRWCPRPPKCS